MKRILIIHKDKMFAEFISLFLDASGFEVKFCYNNVEGFTIAGKMRPDLIIMSKESEYLDATGFMIKKRLTAPIAMVPIFMIGNFSPLEITKYKDYHVEAFLSKKLNPRALVERIHTYFEIPLDSGEQKTPMIMDLHSKGNIIIIQIEGNFDPQQLVMCNFLLRLFCKQNELNKPHVMLIIPSIYPETITNHNLDFLFSFTKFSELTINPLKIQILTNIKQLISLIQAHDEYRNFVFAKDYVDGFKELMADINMETVIPLDFMEKGNVFTLDLYNEHGEVVIPAMTEVTEKMLTQLADVGVTRLKYFSDVDISKIGFAAGINLNAAVFDYITREFDPISTETFDMDVLQQKQNLFFSKVRGQHLILASEDPELRNLITQTIGQYFSIQVQKDGLEIHKQLKENRISIVIIDLKVASDQVYAMMNAIRRQATRRKTTIILLAHKLNKVQLLNYMKAGTDHVILYPYTTNKIYNKVYTSMVEDRAS